jgi:hypothetical protein
MNKASRFDNPFIGFQNSQECTCLSLPETSHQAAINRGLGGLAGVSLLICGFVIKSFSGFLSFLASFLKREVFCNEKKFTENQYNSLTHGVK